MGLNDEVRKMKNDYIDTSKDEWNDIHEKWNGIWESYRNRKLIDEDTYLMMIEKNDNYFDGIKRLGIWIWYLE
jgi:hypothetical protein